MLAGSTPIVGASVQLYAAGTAGNGSAALPLLSPALITDANGAFTVPGGYYNCPSATSIVYLVATGGVIDPASNTAPNSATALMTVPGVCSSISTTASYVVNELTTAASVYALRPFLAVGAQLGSTATNTTGLALGTATVANLVNLTSGTAPGTGFPASGTPPSPKLNSIANLLHTCVASGSPASTPCATLFDGTQNGGTAPTNTLDATLGLVNNPATNVDTLYGLSVTTSAFSPALPTAPADWTLPVAFTGGGMNGPSTVAIDASGNVWVTDNSTTAQVASLFNNVGQPAFANGITGYGLFESNGGAIDTTGRFWVANENNAGDLNGGIGSITLLNTAGPALPGDSQYSAGGLDYPIAIAIDTTDTAWVANFYCACVILLNSDGIPLSGASGYISSQVNFPTAIAVDSKRNGWIAENGGTVTKMAPDGSSFTSYTVSSNEESGVAVDAADNVWTSNYYDNSIGLVSGGQVLSGSGFVGGGLDHPVGIAADGNGTVWVANLRAPGITELEGVSGRFPGAAISPTAGWGSDIAALEAYGIAIDAAGNVWVTSQGDNRLIEYVGLAAPVKTPLLGATRVP